MPHRRPFLSHNWQLPPLERLQDECSSTENLCKQISLFLCQCILILPVEKFPSRIFCKKDIDNQKIQSRLSAHFHFQEQGRHQCSPLQSTVAYLVVGQHFHYYFRLLQENYFQ